MPSNLLWYKFSTALLKNSPEALAEEIFVLAGKDDQTSHEKAVYLINFYDDTALAGVLNKIIKEDDKNRMTRILSFVLSKDCTLSAERKDQIGDTLTKNGARICKAVAPSFK